MAEHKKFDYKTIEELKEEIKQLKLDIPFSDDMEILKEPVKVGNKVIPNALAILPMEGCDGTAEGSPGELTYRRYVRYARGRAGLIWVEATAVVPEGKANPRHLYISSENSADFKKLHSMMVECAKEEYGSDYKPYTVLQLTHSGRYSKPYGKPEPVIASENPYLDKFLPEEYKVITDEELEKLEDRFVEAAFLAREAGFDAVDVKACHRYLNSELLASFTREGKYGGSFENRTRFLFNVVDKIREKLGDTIDITLRLNAYDAIPYPHGFGVDKEDFHKPDLEEPIHLLKILSDKGVKFVNISIGNPYYNPHVGRPYDIGSYIPPENSLQSEAKFLNIIKILQQSVPEIAIMATGFSYFREFAPYIIAGGIKEGWFKMAGFGRQSFAYPDFARDIIQNGKMVRNKCCITCSKCTELMRYGGTTGCVIRDREVYVPIYKESSEGKSSLIGRDTKEHI